MALTLKYSDPQGIYEPAVLVSLGSNVRYGQIALTNNAGVGDAAISQIAIEDPGGILNIVGLRAFDVRETSAPSNNQVIGRFVIYDRKVGRSKERALITGTDRLWTVDLSDYNWHLGARIHVDSDANRHAESAGARLHWLLENAAHINLNDYGHVVYPSHQLDANDFRLQRPINVLADCAVEGGYMFWADFNEAHGRPELFFLDPGGSDYTTDIAVSNVLSDVDSLTVFAPSRDAELNRSPSRIAYGVAVPNKDGFVYVRNDTTGLQFAKIDQVAPMRNVKDARARRIGNKFLADNDEEDDGINFEIIVPRAQVNDVRHGHRMAVRFQHIPGYEDWVGVRVTSRTVIQDADLGDDYYRLDLKASYAGPIDAPPPLATGFLGTVVSGGWPGGGFWTATLEADGVEVLTAAQISPGTLVTFPSPIRASQWRIHLVVNWDTVFMPDVNFNHAVLVGADGTDLFGNGWVVGGTQTTDITSLSTQDFAASGPSTGFSLDGYLNGVAVNGRPTLTVDQTGQWSVHQTDIIANVVSTLHYYWTWTL